VLSVRYKRYALGSLTLVYTLSIADQGLITLLLEPIKEALQLSDTQLGLLAGVAFGIMYAALGVPIARWADQGNRSTITSVMIGLWGAAMMLSVWVSTFTQLLIARTLTAVGEAGCMPPTYSLIGDYFPQAAERTRSMTVYMLANPLSYLLSFIVGGQLNDLYGWRVSFFAAGIPALLLALLVKLSIREPRISARSEIGGTSSPKLSDVLRIMWRQKSTRHLILGLMFAYTAGLALAPWYGAFMVRSHGARIAELGVWFGLIFGIGGVAGVLLGGYVTTHWFGQNERSQMRVIAVVIGLLAPCLALFVLLPGKYSALSALLVFVLAANFLFGPAFALLQRLVADEMRATAAALALLVCNLVGMGIGPQAVGALSDYLRPALGADSLRYSMLAVSILAFWSAYHFWRVGRTVDHDLAAVAGHAKFC
jgi:predicted MFS family arabinose efflux permease